MRDQLAEASTANPEHTRLGAHADHLGRLPRAAFAVHTTAELQHPELECTGALAILTRTKRKYENSAWWRFFLFSSRKKQKEIPAQKVPCFGRSEHVGFVLRNKPAMIFDLGE